MKILFESYSFNAATKQITFNTTDVIGLQHLLIITNVTDNIIIYNFADPAKGGTINNNVLTLDYDTTSMSSSDKLQIFLDNALTPASEESVQYLKKIIQLLTPISVQDSAQRQRVAVEVMPTTTVTGTVTSNIGTGTLAAVTSVTNITQFGGVDPKYQFIDAARLTYAQGIRNNLQFT